MINGGENGAFTAHIPWYHGEKEADAYTFSVKIHNQLRPYMFSTVVDAHISGGTLIRSCNFDEESHKLGENVFTKAITAEGGNTSYHLPSDGEWIDFWTGEKYLPGSLIEKTYALDQFPLFFKSGSITPLFIDDDSTGIGDSSMAGKVTLLIFPNGNTTQVLHLPDGDGIEYTDCTVNYCEKTGVITVKSEKPKQFTVIVKGAKKSKTATFMGTNISKKL